MEARPLKVIPVHEFLRPRLMDLYESDCIFDKFEVSSSASSIAALAGGRGGGFAGGSPPGDGGGGGGGGDLHGVSIITGSYNNTLRVYDVGADIETSIELSKTRPKPPTSRPIPVVGGAQCGAGGPPGAGGGGGGGGATMGAGADVSMDGSWGGDGTGFFGYGGGSGGGGGGSGGGGLDRVDFTKKLLHVSFHPSEPIIAVAGAANLFIFAGGPAERGA